MKLTWLLLLATTLGCTDVTFYEKGRINYDHYTKVKVNVTISTEASDTYINYLVNELKDVSGFVESYPWSSTEATEAQMIVDLTSEDAGTGIKATASYTLIDSDTGATVTSGQAQDTSQSKDEAYEDALDELALIFGIPYRI